MEPKTILVATDLSETGDEAIRCAAARARADGARLVGVHVVPDLQRVAPLFPQVQASAAVDLARWHADLADELARRLAAEGGDGATHGRAFVDEGSAADRIIERAERLHAELVVVGARTGGLGRVAAQVVRHAPCPVLIARAGAHAGPILVATDFSDPAFPALVAGAAEARRATSGMVAIHVVDGLRALVVMATPIPLDLTAHEAVRQRALADGARELEEVMARLEIQGEALIDEGLPAERVVAAARRLDARQIVVGSVGRDGLGRLLLGSVAEEIAHTAPCSVLAVRLHRRRAASAS